MRVWPKPDKHAQEPIGARRVCPFMGRLALLICGLLCSLLGPLAPHVQGYQDESLTLAIAGADGGAFFNSFPGSDLLPSEGTYGARTDARMLVSPMLFS